MLPPRVLEISIISANDLAMVSKTMQTYSVAWVDPERKLTTRVDQTGLNNPNWNEKFVFRVDDRFLTDESSAIMIDIYAAAWLKDALIGSVRVLISHLFGTLTHNNNNIHSSSYTRYVALQVRRPSGRPQGIINLGITLLDNKMRSMPLFADDQELVKVKPNDNAKAKLRRSLSDRTDLTSDQTPAGSVVTGSICNNGSVVKGSVVNGSQCYSDVGPSASIVAAAIAKGLYKTPAPPKTSAGNGGGGGLITEEDMKSKGERWPTAELPPKVRGNSKNGGRARRRTDGGGLFSCFGNAFGCEIAITCGGGNNKKYQNGRVGPLSSVGDNSSYGQSYV